MNTPGPYRFASLPRLRPAPPPKPAGPGKPGRPRGFKCSPLTRLRMSASQKGNTNAAGHRVTASQLANLIAANAARAARAAAKAKLKPKPKG